MTAIARQGLRVRPQIYQPAERDREDLWQSVGRAGMGGMEAALYFS